MATTVPAKSILKQQPAQPTLSDEQKEKAEANKRHVVTALHHANIIQSRKDAEARIFGNIETLLEFPSATPFSPSDASRFVSLIRSFQPSDYDNLVEERRIDGKCGYALCSKSPRSELLGSSAAWKLSAQGAADYCSDRCARKALYVKTQLSEVPAWERQRGQQPYIVLHADDRPAVAGSQSSGINRTLVDHHELALERGETVASRRPGQVMTATIVEKESVAQPVSTSSSEGNAMSSYTAIEGYEPSSMSAGLQMLQGNGSAGDLTTDTLQVNDGEKGEEDEAWRELFSNIEKR